jgi:hypothetical protein
MLSLSWMMVSGCDRVDLWCCVFGVLVDWGVIETPCGPPALRALWGVDWMLVWEDFEEN